MRFGELGKSKGMEMSIKKMLGLSAALATSITVGAGQVAAQSTNGMSYYVGLEVGSASGDNVSGSSEYPTSGTIGGLFVGAETSMGSYNLGGELSVINGADLEEDDWPGWVFKTIVDIEARISANFGQLTPFATLGLSNASFDPEGGAAYKMTGVVTSIGADYSLNDNMAVGLDLTYRDIFDSDNNYGSKFSTVNLRGVYRF